MTLHFRFLLVVVCVAGLVVGMGLPAAADHTDPNSPLTPMPPDGFPGAEPGMARGEGEWDFVTNFPANLASDVKFFDKGGKRYASQGTLGQGPRGTFYVGQRMIQVLDDANELAPTFRADHGSAACNSPATSATGLQHDAFATPLADPEILFDATDAVGRCHDTPGGGLELIDVSGLGDPEFEPREVHLIRFNGYSHTLTVDPKRPWIVFSNSSDFANNNTLDFADIRTCLSESAGGTLADGADLDARRASCRPVVYRIPYEDEWTQATNADGDELRPGSAACHDLVVEDNIIHCSALNAELLLDISDLTDENGDPRGEPLQCEGVEGTNDTAAMVTDCALGGPTATGDAMRTAWAEQGSPQATGWRYLGHFNHPGRNNQFGTTDGNSNTVVRADDGVAVSHETRPIPASVSGDRRFIMVSDERGGGVVPGGASCTDDNFDVYGHGGMHFYDVTDPANIDHAKLLDDDGNEQKAFWRGDVVVPQGTFCVVHRFRFLPGEKRFVMGYYSQGIKIVDYDIDENGYFTFDEVASYTFKDSNTWTGDVFHYTDNADGTRTYHIAASDTLQALGNLTRGMDIISWTGPPNPIDGGCADEPPAAGYTDSDSIRAAHQRSVDCATHREIVRGVGANSYGPTNLVRRDQMASFIAQTLDAAESTRELPLAQASGDRFTDIDGNSHADNIRRLFAARIIAGTSDTTYNPSGFVTRAQMATYVLRAAEWAAGHPRDSLGSSEAAFSDVGAGNVHAATINGAAEQTLVRGRDGAYHPNETIPRDQMASFVTNLLTAVESGAVAARTAEDAADEGAEDQDSDDEGQLPLPIGSTDVGLAITAALVLPGAALFGRRRRR
jgi:hypothetical protein